jgi:hypothetical protein
MPIVQRVTSLPPVAEIAKVPQIVIVDRTGPVITFGQAAGMAMLVAEFLDGVPNAPVEITGDAQLRAVFGGFSAMLSQDASGVQNGAGGIAANVPTAGWNGNGIAQLKGKKFRRLGICRVDTEAVTTDGGAAHSQVAVTITVAAADTTAGATNKDIFLPAGTRFGDNASFPTATKVVMTSRSTTISKGTAVGGGTVVVNVNCVVVKEPEPIVAIAAGQIVAVVDAALSNVDPATTITGVANAAAIWPPGTGTTLSARVESRYQAAIDATRPGRDETNDVTEIWAARRSTTVREALRQNAIDSSVVGRGRVCVVAGDPALGSDAAAALAGITAVRSLGSVESLKKDRVFISWPNTTLSVAELAGAAISVNSDGWLACILNNFAHERNPGANPQGLLDAIAGLEPAYQNNPLQVQDFANLIAAGVCPLTKDRKVGWWYVDGVTAVDPTVEPTRVPGKRRRMADEIQDAEADIAGPFNKEPATQDAIDAFVAETDAYLGGLLSPNDPSRQRIAGYTLDPVSGNTEDLLDLGIFTLIMNVKTLSDFRDIIIQAQIGETVQLAQAA